MSRWGDAEDAMSDDLTDEFGEAIRHQPMRKPDVNGRAEIDPTRPLQIYKAGSTTLSLEGIFEAMAKEVQIDKGHSQSRAVPATRISSRSPRVSVDRRDFVSEPIAGDLIAIVERGTVFEITDIEPDGHGRVWLCLVQRGRQESGQ